MELNSRTNQPDVVTCRHAGLGALDRSLLRRTATTPQLGYFKCSALGWGIGPKVGTLFISFGRTFVSVCDPIFGGGQNMVPKMGPRNPVEGISFRVKDDSWDL